MAMATATTTTTTANGPGPGSKAAGAGSTHKRKTKDPLDAPPSQQQQATGSTIAPSPRGDSSLSPLEFVEETNATGPSPGKRPAARGTAFYPRKRANTACQVCRARKTKCDNLKPSCSYCISVGATCIQSPFDLSSFDPASLQILQRLDELESSIRVLASQSTSSSPPTHSERPDAGRPSLISSRQSGLSCGQDGSLSRNPRDTVRGPSIRSLVNDNEASVEPESQGLAPFRAASMENGLEIDSMLPQRMNIILSWPAFRSVEAESPLAEPYRVPPDALSSLSTDTASLVSLSSLESARIYQLLDDFFLHIHCKNPILDEASARKMVLDAFFHGPDSSPASCLAMIICALGCIATSFGPSDKTKKGTPAYDESQAFFQAAQKRIGTLLTRSDILGAQCLFLSGIYLMMVFQPIYAWRFFSQALAACQHLPFLAKAQTVRSSPLVLEMAPQDTQEQAVYWSAWKSERELRQELDIPDFALSHGHTLYPPFFPAPPSTQPASFSATPGSQAHRAHSSWMFYLAEISLRRLTSRLSSELLDLRERYPSNPKLLDVLADMTPEYEAQVREWSNSLPADLSLATSRPDDDGICRSVLRGRMINLLEMIYWPFVMACISSHASGRALIAPRAEQLARRGLDTHIDQIDVNRPGFCHRHHGGYFMIRSCTRSALVLMAAAAAGCAMPPAWRDAVPQVLGMLSYWEDEDADVPRWKATLERALSSWQAG